MVTAFGGGDEGFGSCFFILKVNVTFKEHNHRHKLFIIFMRKIQGSEGHERIFFI